VRDEGSSGLIMQRSIWVNALLAVAVAALGAWAYFMPSRDTPVTHPLSALQRSDAASIRIERPGASAVLLVKKEGSWRIAAPFEARGDEARVDQLLGILEARAVHKLAAADLARFELDQPRARLTIAGPAASQSFAFGMVSEVTREQYVRTGDAVYPLSPRYGAALPANPAELISNRLFAPGETPVRIALQSFAVEQEGGKWRQTPPAPDLGQDDFNRWIEEWRNAAAVRVEPHAGGRAAEEIRVELKDRGALALSVLAREPDLVLLRPDEKLRYYIRGDVAMRLLVPPGAAAAGPPSKK
jgi:hypothetical protein